MSEFLTTATNKISSYSLINYFLPGILFCLVLKYIVGFNILIGSNIENSFICYFLGMVVSRIGSLWVERVLKCFNFLVFADYKDFVKAESKDISKKLTVLSDINNSFRSYLTVFLVTFCMKVYKLFSADVCNKSEFLQCFLLLVLLILFLFSFRKQTSFICKRVQTILAEKNI